MRIATLAVIAAALSLPVAGSATAAGHTWPVGNGSLQVRFADLDLRSTDGRAEALLRVERAASRVCQDIGVRRVEAACRARTLDAFAAGHGGATLRRAIAERTLSTRLAQAR